MGYKLHLLSDGRIVVALLAVHPVERELCTSHRSSPQTPHPGLDKRQALCLLDLIPHLHRRVLQGSHAPALGVAHSSAKGKTTEEVARGTVKCRAQGPLLDLQP